MFLQDRRSFPATLVGQDPFTDVAVIKIEGEDPGSPENPKMPKKFIYCTGITTILFIIIYLLMKFEYLNLRNIVT